MKNKSAELFQEYKKRGIVDQLILQFLAIQVGVCRQTGLAQCLAAIKLKGLPRIKISAANLGKQVRPMVQKGLILKDKYGLSYASSLRSHVVLDCLQKKTIRDVGQSPAKDSSSVLIKPFSDSGPGFRPGQGGESVLAEIDGKKLRAVRNLKAEQQAAGQLVEKSGRMSSDQLLQLLREHHD